jgi:hypothetical protein
MVHAIDLNDPKQIRDYISIPGKVYTGIPQWVPPLDSDIRNVLNPHTNPVFSHGEATFLIAYDQKGQPAGRLAMIDNHDYNHFNHENTAFFYQFECINDHEIVAALFHAGIEWAKKRQLTKIIGPKGFTVLDGIGLLVKGFEYRPALGLPYNPEYYISLIEEQGFRTISELGSGFIDPRLELSEKIHRAAGLVMKRRGLKVLTFPNRLALARYIPKIIAMYNQALDGTTGNTPLSKQDANTLSHQLLWFADPRLIKIILKDDEPVGFVFAYPDVSAALQRTGGKIFPFGWMDLLIETRLTDTVNINGAAITEPYRGLGGTALLYSELSKTISGNQHFKHAEIVQIGLENEQMQLEMRNIGVTFCKIHRLYGLGL